MSTEDPTSRPFDAMERMTDRFDRAVTLNFTVEATVRGPLPEADLRAGLRALEARHPLLRAAIDRSGDTPRFVAGMAAEIPLTTVDGDRACADAYMARSVEHMRWEDAGPRARLRAIRLSDAETVLQLTLHHNVSDGSSGILAMRDLLRASQGIALGEPLPSPGPMHFLPPTPQDAGARVGEILAALGAVGEAERPRDGEAPLEARAGHLRRLRLDRAQTTALLARTRSAGATLQGMLTGAIGCALAADWDGEVVFRIAHPFDLRRYLTAHVGACDIGDRIGYYVSSVDTAHRFGPGRAAEALAGEVSDALARAKADGVPLLYGPVGGVSLVEQTAALDDDGFRELAEQKLMRSAFALSNLGPLERLGAGTEVGALRVTDMHFCSANSVFGALGATATSFDGALTLNLRAVTPLVGAARLDRLYEGLRCELCG